MDILYKLPLPEEICSKIFIYACKSPHSGLGVGMFENKLQIMDLDIPDNDIDITSFDANKQDYFTYNTIHIDIFTCFPNLNTIDLGGGKVCVSGDIGDLVSLKKLSVIDFYNKNVYGSIENFKSFPTLSHVCLSKTEISGDITHLKFLHNLSQLAMRNTGITGDIVHLKSLHNLFVIVLAGTGVYGDISHFKSLHNLTIIDIGDTMITGNIEDLKILSNLTHIDIENTTIWGDKREFHVYRDTKGLPYCTIYD
tara:strand:+ start:1526 stop:2284 length:759 start_codon:yes stop_codon:yes gene_type:complete